MQNASLALTCLSPVSKGIKSFDASRWLARVIEASAHYWAQIYGIPEKARIRLPDVNVLTAIFHRLDKAHTRLLAEIRATRSQV